MIFALIEGLIQSFAENRWWPVLLVVLLAAVGTILVLIFD
jgi:putative exporter of polyketide antibiotics